nr:MAG TPA: hypothetical protein [Bacteriophage sp.]
MWKQIFTAIINIRLIYYLFLLILVFLDNILVFFVNETTIRGSVPYMDATLLLFWQ